MSLEDFDIRYSEVSDLSYLEEWFSNCRACDEYPFAEEEKGEALKNWIGFSKFRASLTGMLSGQPCAIGTLFLMPYKKVAHHASFYIVVEEKSRRKGVGESMVRNLLHLAKTRFRLESIHVEIFDPAPIQPILEKLKFHLFARQERYIKMEDGTYRARLLWEHRC